MEDKLNLTPELLEQASKAPSAAALLALAQENGITLTAEEATLYFAQLHPQSGALSDEELDNVSGGGCNDLDEEQSALYETCRCGSREFVLYTPLVHCKHCKEQAVLK